MKTVDGWTTKEPDEGEKTVSIIFAAKRAIEDSKVLKIMAWRSGNDPHEKVKVAVALFNETRREDECAEFPNGHPLMLPGVLKPESTELVPFFSSENEQQQLVDETLVRCAAPYLASIVAIRDAIERGETP